MMRFVSCAHVVVCGSVMRMAVSFPPKLLRTTILQLIGFSFALLMVVDVPLPMVYLFGV